MLESLSCPSCFTHYGLRPERVHQGIRRARCFRCGETFDITAAVAHLLTPAPSPAPSLAESSATVTLEGIKPEDLLELDTHPAIAPAPDAPAPESALTLGDLESDADEILEKTLVIDPPVDAELQASEEGAEVGGFASAKDAIARLLGDGPAPVTERRGAGRTSSMDVEATLDALENTLGGTPARELDGPRPAASPEVAKPSALGSTVRLSSSELQAAMAAAGGASPAQAQAPTVAIPVPGSTRPGFVPPPQTPAADPGDPNLLKIQVGQDVFQNVTLDQLTTWIEQGRVQDWHMVARQFSENWIEAGKVPSLRPVFERLRRQPHASDAPVALEAAPAKKGLFGWMSNRN